MSAEIHHLPSPKERGIELTSEQEIYWWQQYEIAQRMSEYAMRQLGIVKPEKGISDEGV